ncbi:MAG: ankyrin repeat domain-containing protein [Chlamydiota bacterium]
MVDEQKSEDTSDHYTISNPLVLLVGIEKYPYCNFDDLPGVESDMKILYKLFSMKCGYEVRSTYHKGNTYVGKAVRKEEFDDFLLDQYTYLRSHRKKFDALIFFFSGHGNGDFYGNDSVFTSDGKSMYFHHIEKKFTYGADDTFLEDFARKPKLFFKLACRGKGKPKYIKQSKRIRGDSELVSAGSEVFIACATSPGYSMYDASGATFSNILSSSISKYLGNKKGHLSDIAREIRVGLSNREAPETTMRLTKKVFFSPKIKRKPLDKETETKWWRALEEGDEETIKNILSHYVVDVNAKDQFGYTPLHLAALKNHKEVTEILIREDANVNAKNNYGETPLHIAALKNHKEVAQILLREGDDVNKNIYGYTPLHLATINNHKEITEILIREGANVNAKNNDGNTPLHDAAWRNYKEVARILINAGADKNVKNNFNQTPLDVAKRKGHKEIVGLLKPKGIFSIFGL